MWRAVVAVAHADNHIDPSEKEHIQKTLKKLPLTDEQLEALNSELHSPANIDSILTNITNPGDRAQVVYFARLLMWADGHLNDDENEILKHIHSQVMSKTDVQEALQKIHTMEAQVEQQSDQEIYKSKSGSFLFKKFLDWMMF